MTANDTTRESGQESSDEKIDPEAAAAAAGVDEDVTDPDVRAQSERLVELDAREDTERWEYDSRESFTYIRCSLFYSELDTNVDDIRGEIETYPVRGGTVPIGVTLEGEAADVEVGTMVHLSPEAAEAFAVDLLEQAHEARARTRRRADGRE